MDPDNASPSSLTTKPSKPPPTPLLLFLFLFTISLLTTPSTSLPSSAAYTQHCNHVVPQSPIDPSAASSARDTALVLRLATSFYVKSSDQPAASLSSDSSRSLYFFPRNVHKTVTNDVYTLKAQLSLTGPISGSRNFPPMSFFLHGFWSESTKKLCMVGSGAGNVLLKLNYPKSDHLSIFDSLVTGVLESLDDKSSLRYFEPVSILSVAKLDEHYKFLLTGRGNESDCLSETDEAQNLSLEDLGKGICSLSPIKINVFELDHGIDCRNVSCNVLVGGDGGGADAYLPKFMLFKILSCVDNRKFHMLLGFQNRSHLGGNFPFDPHTSLIAEGTWDQKNNQICAVACRIVNFTRSLGNAVVGDCSIKLSLRFPAVWSIRQRSSVAGQIWSNRSVKEPGYFGKVGFHGSQKPYAPTVKYVYTKTENVRKSCTKSNKAKGKTYPTADSYNMKFDMFVTNSKGQVAQGFALPLFVGDQIYQQGSFDYQFVPFVKQNGSAVLLTNSRSSQLNISYKLVIKPSPNYKLGTETLTAKVEIAAEGSYNSDTGGLCMIGCRHLDQKLMKNNSQDCAIVINIQFSPLNAKVSEPVKGTIESTRKKSDTLYFERLELSSKSIYTSQAAATIWRMDLEISMVLISNTLVCVFVGLQLFHVKKNENVLSHISVVMLVILTLAHMIPLLLNFEDMFKGNRSQQNVFLGSGGWLEVNEIIVRVVTMLAFLLQFRLLQLSWSARKGDEIQDLWVSERKVLYIALPLYICGGLISWFVHQLKTSYDSPFLQPRRNLHRVFNRSHLYKKRSFWVDLRSYGGLILDGFLLPQILFNIFSNSREQPLAMCFYIGTTLVRLLPHAYDLYRAHSSVWYLDVSFIYANHKMDLYSTAWDIIIPCGGLFLAILIFLQQRFGGRSILPKRFREGPVYEKVPTVGNEELQGEPVHKNFYTL